MYSKAGKATNQIFMILQHGEDILEPKNRQLKWSLSSHSMGAGDKLAELAAKRFGKNPEMKNIAELLEVDEAVKKDEKSPTSLSRSPKERKRVEPFSKFVSRDDREKILSYKTVSSNAAYYSPKYDRIEKKAPNLVDYSKLSSKRLFDEIISSVEPQSPNQSGLLLPPIDIIKEKVRGAIPLDHQVGRPDVLEEAKKKKICISDALSNPGLPESLSTIQRLPSIRFSKSLPRKEMIIESGGQTCPIYDAKFEFVKKSLGHVGPKFDKTTARKYEIRKPYYTSEAVYEYDKYVKSNNSRVFPKVNYPAFDKMAPRERHPESGIPTYLQDVSPRLAEPIILKSSDQTARTEHHVGGSPRNVDTSIFNTSVLNPKNIF